MARKRKRYAGRVYLGHGKRHWVGRFATKRPVTTRSPSPRWNCPSVEAATS
jgi:hypothetical protein